MKLKYNMWKWYNWRWIFLTLTTWYSAVEHKQNTPDLLLVILFFEVMIKIIIIFTLVVL